jgi:DNA-directed RNA polymerase subunit RPC12/RpoP
MEEKKMYTCENCQREFESIEWLNF